MAKLNIIKKGGKMILEYTDILGDRKKHRVNAEVTTEHPASHYGIPVIVLDDGNALDLQSWVMLGYRVVKASPKEAEKLEKVFANFSAMAGEIISQQQSLVDLPRWTCNRPQCGHSWTPRKPEKPIVCPKCKSPYWDR